MIVTDSRAHRNWRFLTFDSSPIASLGQSGQQGGPGGSGQTGGSGQFGHPGQSYQSGQCCQSGHSLHDFTILIICALHNFQFYLAHLWTDFQSYFPIGWSRMSDLDIVKKISALVGTG